MKKHLQLFSLLMFIAIKPFAQSQTNHVPGPVERRITDSICACVTKLDMAKITNKQEAVEAYTNCITQKSDMLVDLANEDNVEMTDVDAMKKIGVNIAVNLMKQGCPNFTKLGLFFAKKDGDVAGNLTGSTRGNYKRTDLKGFNYIVITDNGNSEKSFIWLRQFPGSEKFMNGSGSLAGKKLNVSWQEIEVYLPQAKGYYKVKEITGITIL